MTLFHLPILLALTTTTTTTLCHADTDANRAPSQNIGFMAQVLQKSDGQNICKPEGFVMDTYSDFDRIESVNHRVSTPLERLTKTKFFRTLKVDLYRECQFWATEGSCFQRDCIVQPLDDQDVPRKWKQPSTGQTQLGPFMASIKICNPL